MKKIAIASEKNNINSLVCKISGRAPYYLIFENKKLIKTIKNPFVSGSGGAGSSVVQMLYNENVDLVISGKFGENMISSFKEKGMDYKIVLNKTIIKTIEEI